MFVAFVPIFAWFTMATHPVVPPKAEDVHILAKKEFSLEKRYDNTFVNDVFKDNILLTLAYMEDKKLTAPNINWDTIEKPFDYKLTLRPKESFAFHDDVLPEYVGKVDKTTNSHFNFEQGFKSDGWLTGDGVCHLASLMYWAAKDAGLSALAPTRHDFANIPEVPREYGVSIFDVPGQSGSNEAQNLYITNNLGKDVTFDFDYNGETLKVSVVD